MEPGAKTAAKKRKNIAIATILGIVVGPFGILYSSMLIGSIMTVIGVIVFLVGDWLGLAIYWPVCSLLSWALAYFNNKSASAQ